MDYKNQLQARPRRFHRWFRWRNKKRLADPFDFGEVSSSSVLDDEVGDDDVDYSNDGFIRSDEIGSCILNHEFRVFVGTWNVAGRSPVGSLAVDLDDWLNLKDAADIYVLGFQEIVPLKALNVIGAEDITPASKWNSLIGKTLNNKFGCSPCLTPNLHQSSSHEHDYLYFGISGSESRTYKSLTETEEPNVGSKYKLIASKKMVGVFISVWMKDEVIRKYCISNVKVCSVACGVLGYLGNKGSVSVSLSIEGTSFCFIAAHLASGEKNGDELQRNYQVSEIFRRTCFPRLRDNEGDNTRPLTILGHDRIFWLGDLNYRLCLEDGLARELIKKKDWRGLQEFDQLRKELQDFGGVFEGWSEGDLEFAPTYKYASSNCNRYSGGGFPRASGEKQRTPAWCDRILWYGKGVKQLSYFRTESKFSDHRPVSALFSTHIEVVRSIDPTVAKLPTFLPAIPPLNNHIVSIQQLSQSESKGEVEKETTTTLLSLLVKDIEASPTQNDPTSVITYLASSIG